jgi:hypothetical protein
MHKLWLGFLATLSFSLIFACSSAPESKKTTEATPSAVETAAKKEPILNTGKACFTRMMDQAQRWSPDALPVHLESDLNAESLGHDGKSTIWKGIFVSTSRNKMRTFTCSGSRLPDEPPVGISATPETASSPAIGRFHPSYFVMDSDKAFALAQEKGGAKLTEKDPNQPVLYSLDWDAAHNQLVWVVIYGKDVKQSKGMGVMDASTGKFLRASK